MARKRCQKGVNDLAVNPLSSLCFLDAFLLWSVNGASAFHWPGASQISAWWRQRRAVVDISLSGVLSAHSKYTCRPPKMAFTVI